MLSALSASSAMIAPQSSAPAPAQPVSSSSNRASSEDTVTISDAGRQAIAAASGTDSDGDNH